MVLQPFKQMQGRRFESPQANEIVECVQGEMRRMWPRFNQIGISRHESSGDWRSFP
jgi:hypothetical protein